MSKQENPREFTRVTTGFTVEIEAEGRTIESARMQDLSMNGVFVICEDRLPLECDCRVTLRLGDPGSGIKITAAGKVMRHGTEPPGFALQFSELDVESYEHLRQLVLLNSQDPDQVEQEISGHLGLKRRR